MKIHSICVEEFKEIFFRNVIDIEQYKNNVSFYKHFLDNDADNEERLEYLS